MSPPSGIKGLRSVIGRGRESQPPTDHRNPLGIDRPLVVLPRTSPLNAGVSARGHATGLSQAGAPPDATVGVHVTSGPGRLSRTRRTGSIPTCCAICRDAADWCTAHAAGLSVPCRDGPRARCCRRGPARCQLLRRGVARGARPSRDLRDQGSQSPASTSPTCSRRLASHLGTARAAGWTTCSSSGCGAHSVRMRLSESTGSEARSGISWWMDFYNERRPHSALGPDAAGGVH